MSLTFTKKRVGLSALPWGTPAFTECNWEIFSFYLIFNWRSSKYDCKTLWSLSGRARLCFKSKPWCQTWFIFYRILLVKYKLSKSFEKYPTRIFFTKYVKNIIFFSSPIFSETIEEWNMMDENETENFQWVSQTVNTVEFEVKKFLELFRLETKVIGR